MPASPVPALLVTVPVMWLEATSVAFRPVTVPAETRDWLDRVIDKLHAGGIAVVQVLWLGMLALYLLGPRYLARALVGTKAGYLLLRSIFSLAALAAGQVTGGAEDDHGGGRRATIRLDGHGRGACPFRRPTDSPRRRSALWCLPEVTSSRRG